MLLEAYPRYTRDSKKRAIDIPGMPEEVSKHETAECFGGDFRKFHMART